MKNKNALISGIAAGLISVIFINELVQAAVAAILGADNIGFSIEWFFFYAEFTLPEAMPIAYKIPALLTSFMLTVAMMEFSARLMVNSRLGFKRFFNIVFQVVIVGYLNLTIFYSAFVIILDSGRNNDFARMLRLFDLSKPIQILIMIFIIVLTVFYIGTFNRRLKVYIGANQYGSKK